jgi:F-type H+-transporting ATPase subunit delta
MSQAERRIVNEIYSEVLFVLAEQSKALDSVQEELAAVCRVLKLEPEFGDLLCSQLLRGQEKVEIVRRIFDGRLSELTVNFLAVLARRGRMGYLAGVSEEYEILVDTHHNRRAVEVTVPKMPDDAELDRLRRQLAEALESEVKVHVKVDPKIIGGIIIQKEDTMIDNSIRTVLERMVATVTENMKQRQKEEEQRGQKE